MAIRYFRKVVSLPDHLTPEDLGRLGRFVFERAGLGDATTKITTSEGGDISGLSFDDAWAGVEPDEELVTLDGVAGTVDGTYVRLRWDRNDGDPATSEVQVRGSEQTWVLGLAELYRSYITRTLSPPPGALAPEDHGGATEAEAADQRHLAPRTPGAADPRSDLATIRRRLVRSWWSRNGDDLKVQVIGGLVVAIVVAAVTALWIF